MDRFPDSPEAVALALLDRILDRDADAGQSRPNRPTDERLLELYAKCLKTVAEAERVPLYTLH